MDVLFSNNAKSTLASTANAAATSFTLNTGDGSLFPSPDVPTQRFWLRFGTNDTNEVVRCTARSSDTITCSALVNTWPSGTEVKLLLNQEALYDFHNAITRFFDITNYGAKVDGTTDDTTAVQAAIDAAVAAGGGVVFFPEGTTVINGALQDTSNANCQLLLPAIDSSTAGANDNPLTIVFRGVYPPYMEASETVEVNNISAGSVIKGTLTTGVGGALLGGSGASGAVTDIYGVVENLTFQMGENQYLTAINFSKLKAAQIRDCLIYTGEFGFSGPTQPTIDTSYGVKMPFNGAGINSIADNVSIQGFYNGIAIADHFTSARLTIWRCVRGLVVYNMDNPAFIGRLAIYWCTYGIYSILGNSYLTISQLELHRAPSGAATWMKRVNDIIDSSNYIYGNVNWQTVGPSGIDSTLSKSGGANLVCTELRGRPPTAQATRSTAQTIAISTPTAINFTTEAFDNGSIHNTSTNNERLTCTTPGLYLIHFMGQFASNATGTYRTCYILKNGTTTLAQFSRAPGQDLLVSCVAELALNDYVELVVLHDASASLDIESNSGLSPVFTMVRLG